MRSARRQLIIITVVLLVGALAGVTLFTASGGDDSSGTHRASDSSRTLGSVDGVRLAGFDSKEPVELASFQGKPLVVNFWASWCLFCIEEMPDFQSVYEDVGDDVGFLGVNIQDELGIAKQLRKTTGVRYPLASDPRGDVFQQLKSRSMPTTIFVDDRGGIVERFSGPLTERELRERIRKHFGI